MNYSEVFVYFWSTVIFVVILHDGAGRGYKSYFFFCTVTNWVTARPLPPCNISIAFDNGNRNERTTQRWFRKFCSEKKNLNNKHRGKATLVDDDRPRALTDADPSRPRVTKNNAIGWCLLQEKKCSCRIENKRHFSFLLGKYSNS